MNATISLLPLFPPEPPEPDRGYTQKTNETLALGNASPLPFVQVATTCDAREYQPENTKEPSLDEGVSFREAMADQGDMSTKLSMRRR